MGNNIPNSIILIERVFNGEEKCDLNLLEQKPTLKEVTTSDIGGEDGNAPCSSQQLPSTPLPSTVRPLNKLELTRQEQDNTMVQVFLHREDLMERILAYKMLRGRVESYLTMKAKIDLNSCIVPEYEVFF
jgi:hypothetical protein